MRPSCGSQSTVQQPILLCYTCLANVHGTSCCAVGLTVVAKDSISAALPDVAAYCCVHTCFVGFFVLDMAASSSMAKAGLGMFGPFWQNPTERRSQNQTNPFAVHCTALKPDDYRCSRSIGSTVQLVFRDKNDGRVVAHVFARGCIAPPKWSKISLCNV